MFSLLSGVCFIAMATDFAAATGYANVLCAYVHDAFSEQVNQADLTLYRARIDENEGEVDLKVPDKKNPGKMVTMKAVIKYKMRCFEFKTSAVIYSCQLKRDPRNKGLPGFLNVLMYEQPEVMAEHEAWVLQKKGYLLKCNPDEIAELINVPK